MRAVLNRLIPRVAVEASLHSAILLSLYRLSTLFRVPSSLSLQVAPTVSVCPTNGLDAELVE